MSKRIKWEKWADPFRDDEPKDIKNADDEERTYKDSYEEAEQSQRRTRYSGPVLVGPMGIIPITENNSPSKVYNFWMLHSNFNLSEPVVNQLKQCPGVETLDVFTRYRARIGIGKVFNEEKVKKRINKALCEEHKKEDLPIPQKLDKLDILKKQLTKQYKFWAVAVQKNGEIKVFGGDTKEFVDNKVSEIEYEKLQKSWE